MAGGCLHDGLVRQVREHLGQESLFSGQAELRKPDAGGNGKVQRPAAGPGRVRRPGAAALRTAKETEKSSGILAQAQERW